MLQCPCFSTRQRLWHTAICEFPVVQLLDWQLVLRKECLEVQWVLPLYSAAICIRGSPLDVLLLEDLELSSFQSRWLCPITTTTFVPNYSSFDFFDSKFDHSSYSKNCANVVKFKSFLKILYR